MGLSALRRDLLSEQSLQTMTNFGQGPSNGEFGFAVSDQTDFGTGFGVKTIGFGGFDVGGYSTTLNVIPSKEIVISVMTNMAGAPPLLVGPHLTTTSFGSSEMKAEIL